MILSIFSVTLNGKIELEIFFAAICEDTFEEVEGGTEAKIELEERNC